ncbi:23S rRNA (pseudouridine(1915)-N(3))-methyltransferase RlmH [Asticcacaulis taihuensis]|jgi:23S rRNA (pseudouridine1915-N3)-methyltransferase|uniref:Ribosomal RNA large subunit methyltransferase H n=1 Tax=Asticcacaulis taihuensis TaxID=260084 RepID=A0A1G4RLR2_9CAUL|nr:23S rRNA (pseudouridine(1915)-N(3))-methyltransferase RlmH [Asticcacaulis taihuensis]SCW57667.1 23S rRNA (pseudouridine1915-N3)-methyltransferase [Asticcacaulis taihuensis]
MKLTLCAIGKLGATVENNLVKDYLNRASLTGRGLGISPVDLLEVEAKRGAKAATSALLKAQEMEAIRSGLGEGGILITCDEHGEQLTSRQIAQRLNTYKDRGERRVTFLIGGADGLDPALLKSSAFSLAFGPQTWPHALVRVMLAEQMYRATTILAGLPYHRD